MFKIFGLSLALFLAAIAPASAQEKEGKVLQGTLTCTVAPSFGYLVASRRTAECSFSAMDDMGEKETYVASATRVGLDFGYRGEGTFIWNVYAPANAGQDLSGTYVGLSGDVSIGLGGGANVLVGGSANSVTLQPLSVEAQKGLAIALGGMVVTLERR